MMWLARLRPKQTKNQLPFYLNSSSRFYKFEEVLDTCRIAPSGAKDGMGPIFSKKIFGFLPVPLCFNFGFADPKAKKAALASGRPCRFRNRNQPEMLTTTGGSRCSTRSPVQLPASILNGNQRCRFRGRPPSMPRRPQSRWPEDCPRCRP